MSEALQNELKIIEDSANVIAAALPQADIAIVLGSGLGALADTISDAKSISYADIPHFPQPTVFGHSGRLIFGRIGEKNVYVFSGRFHYYEGNDPHTVILPVRVLHKLGCQKLILTNAAGGINPSFSPGDLMLIRDHINFTGYNPLRGENADEWGPRFPDMTNMYDNEYQQIAKSVAAKLGITLQVGVYCGLSGPTFETPAEIKMFRLLGADAVGMSTVPEAIAACHMGMRLLALSCITNMAAGITKQPLTHEEVTETGKKAEEKFSSLIIGVLKRI
jgi:purine-nucleoside phosphorylase